MQWGTSLWSRALMPSAMAVVVLALAPSSAAAQNSGWGVRGGVSADPDQFYFGAHYETPELVDNLVFRPNVEVGLGDDRTHSAFNFEFVYYIPIRNLRGPFQVYAGGGPALNHIQFDEEVFGPDVDETEPGFNFLGGLLWDSGLITEVKFGVEDSPRVKFGVGFTW